MKKLYILLVALVGMTGANAQPCLPEGIIFNYQWQINNFQSNYPGCTVIEGNVTIFDNYSGNINNLNGLNVLTSIVGQLVIYDNNALNSLTGLNNLTSIGGDLAVNGNNSLTSLTGLENLTSVGGDLTIGGGNSLTSLAGLNNLSYIGGTLRIIGANALINLTGLQNLTSIDGDLLIGDNYSGSGNALLTNFTGLENLTTIGGDIYIRYNYGLLSLSGLDNIDAGSINNLSIYSNISLSSCDVQSICNYLASPNGTVIIYGNEAGCANPGDIANSCGFAMTCLPFGNYYFAMQSDVDGFPANYPGCTQLEGEEVIIYGNGISNLDSLSVITEIAGTLRISGNDVISDLSGLENLISIGGWLIINHDNNLTNLMGLNNLMTIGAQFEIYQNNDIINLTGLDNLTSIGGSLQISNNDALTSLSGMNNLASVGGLSIDDNDALINLNGINNLTSLGFLSISDNDGLITLEGLSNNINSIEGLAIQDNIAIESLEGLDNLNSIGGIFNITNNNSLTNLSGLDSLISIGSLMLKNNDALVNLEGLNNLTTVSSIHIGEAWPPAGNPSLTSLSGLDNVEENSIEALYIAGNFSLSNCDVQSICDYLASPNGTVTIGINAPGCNSPEEVEAHCLTAVDEQRIGNVPVIIPNPSNDLITISTPAITASTQLSIFNVNGEKVMERQLTDNKTKIDISALPQGVYFVKVQDEKMVEVGKMVKE